MDELVQYDTGTNSDNDDPPPGEDAQHAVNSSERPTHTTMEDCVTDDRIDISPRTIHTHESAPSNSFATGRGADRPRRNSRERLPSVATPDGPSLTRNPENATANAEESARYKRLTAANNRLGGRDLRVLRDNFEAMGGQPEEKRPASEVSTSTPNTYVTAKRMKTKKRLDSLDREMALAEAQQVAAAADMMQMLVFFREEADRRGEAEKKRRREDREERRDAEKRDERRGKPRRNESARSVSGSVWKWHQLLKRRERSVSEKKIDSTRREKRKRRKVGVDLKSASSSSELRLVKDTSK